MLPVQPAYSDHYSGRAGGLEQSLFETIAWASGFRPPVEEFDLVLSKRFTLEEMGSNPIALRFLEMLIAISGAKRVLEIGSFVGVSSMCLARALPPGGKVVTIEKFDEFAAIAKENFKRNGFEDKIELIVGDALEEAAKVRRLTKFDLIFVDGNKEHYDDYFRMLEPALSPGGLMVVDDCFFHGDALNKLPGTEKGRGVRKLLETVSQRGDLQRLALPISNGLLIIWKPPAALGPAKTQRSRTAHRNNI